MGRLLRILACVFLVLMVAPRSALAWSIELESPAAAGVHSDGTPCHDGTDSDAPCDAGCSCVCCATLRVAPPPTVELSALVPRDAFELAMPEPIDLHPIQPVVRLFRPPRA